MCFYPGQIVGLHLRIFELYNLLLFFALLRYFVCVFRVFAIIPNSVTVTCSRKKEALNNEKPGRVCADEKNGTSTTHIPKDDYSR
jgi:hypothetical protein